MYLSYLILDLPSSAYLLVLSYLQILRSFVLLSLAPTRRTSKLVEYLLDVFKTRINVK